jgi:hypothetical protein
MAAIALMGACGGSGGDGGFSGDVEELCRSWCSGSSVCGDRQTPDKCLTSCVQAHESPCGPHLSAQKACELDRSCNDEFRDCDVRQEAYNECLAQRSAFCGACDPPLGSASYSECLDSQQCHTGCDAGEVPCDGVCIDEIDPVLTSIQTDVFEISCTASSCHDADVPAGSLDLSTVTASEANLVTGPGQQTGRCG